MERKRDWLWLQLLFLRHDMVRFLRWIRLIGPDKRPKPIDPPKLPPPPTSYAYDPPFRVLGTQMIGSAGIGKTLTMNIPEALSRAPLVQEDRPKDEEPEE